MPPINSIIPPAGFELVRDQIAGIIYSELFNQFRIAYDPDFNAAVLIEDMDPIDQARSRPTINVSWAGGPYDNKDYSGHSRGTYTFFIDAWAHSKTTAIKAGDYSAAQKLEKVMRVIRYILDNPIYKTLGFQPPFVERVRVVRMDLQNQPGSNDAVNTMMGRITFEVVLIESVDLIIPKLIAGYDTVAMLGNSNRGYFYSGDNYQ
jgi:hypothetical protein